MCAVTLDDCKTRDIGGRCFEDGEGRGRLLMIGG